MVGSSKTATDHETIKRWAEARGGKPTIVCGTEGRGPGAGLLCLDFEGAGEGKVPKLEPVSWDEFFRTFDDKHLAFLYQAETADGSESRIFKFVNRESNS